mgnify:CR=1 FL=1
MLVTQKCQYALRALFSLAHRTGPEGPVKIALIAEEQDIPIRFLEVILGQLKQSGFVESRRGTEGGYQLARPAEEITVGDIVRCIDGPIHIPQVQEVSANPNPYHDFFEGIWQQAQVVVFEYFDSQTLAELVRQAQTRRLSFVPYYEI